MSRFVRPSKYRHTFGQPAKKENTYDNVKISASAWDTNLAAVNPKYVAINSQVSGGGAFQIIPLSKTGKVPDVYPLVRAHAAPVLDTAWNPFDDQIIASAGEDSRVQITRVDDDALEAAWLENGVVEDIKPLPLTLSHGGRKAGHVLWHPTASGVLASASADIRIWDIEASVSRIELQAHPDMVQSLSFNSTGSLLATTCKDKKLRLFDVRASTSPISTTESHSGVKGSRVCWLGQHDRLVTTGFSRMSDRQVFLWDTGSLEKPIKQISVDTSSGTLMPFWSDNNILFLAGKGDGNVRYYEYEKDDLLYLTEYKSPEPQRGMTFMPRRGLNVSECEIAKAYKVASNMIEPISFIVPRKSEIFQSDIFPPAPSAQPALTASQFFSGETKAPIYIDLESGQNTSAPVSSPYTPSAPTPSSTTSSTPASATTTSAPASASSAGQSTFSKIKEAVVAPVRAATEPFTNTEPSKESSQQQERQASLPSSKSYDRLPSPSSTPASASASVPTPPATESGNEEALKAEIAALKEELNERDILIRGLELKVERMSVAHRKAQELFASI